MANWVYSIPLIRYNNCHHKIVLNWLIFFHELCLNSLPYLYIKCIDLSLDRYLRPFDLKCSNSEATHSLHFEFVVGNRHWCVDVWHCFLLLNNTSMHQSWAREQCILRSCRDLLAATLAWVSYISSRTLPHWIFGNSLWTRSQWNKKAMINENSIESCLLST